jgi:protease-4
MTSKRTDWYPATILVGVLGGLAAGAIIARLGFALPYSVDPLWFFGAAGLAFGLVIGERHHDIASVEIHGEIVEDAGLFDSEEAGARDVCDTIEGIDAEPDQEGLLLEINSPGGSPVASEAIHKSINEFDGPTVAVVTETCASGGYLIASACDHIIARPASLVGSIGVIGSKVNAADMADELGLEYERFGAGEYKDAGVPLDETSEDEREYLQGLIDDYYDRFVELVAEGRTLDPDAIRATEARVFLGETALDEGLIDDLGDARDARDWLESELSLENYSERTYQPSGGGSPFSSVAQRFGYGLGSAISERFDMQNTVSIEVKR